MFSILHPETRFSSATLSLPAAISHYQRDAAATRAMRTTEGSMTRFVFFQKPTFAARSAGPEKNDNKANSGEQESAGDGGFGGGGVWWGVRRGDIFFRFFFPFLSSPPRFTRRRPTASLQTALKPATLPHRLENKSAFRGRAAGFSSSLPFMCRHFFS